MIKRFVTEWASARAVMEEDPYGDWVRSEDYDVLLQAYTSLLAELDNLEKDK